MSKQSSVYGQLYTSQCFLQTRGPGTLMNLSILTPFFIEYGFYYPNLNRTKNWKIGIETELNILFCRFLVERIDICLFH